MIKFFFTPRILGITNFEFIFCIILGYLVSPLFVFGYYVPWVVLILILGIVDGTILHWGSSTLNKDKDKL